MSLNRWQAAVVTLLAALQLAAFALQLILGFRPFGRPPQRVPLSWDMFAVRVERCALSWRPPVVLGGRRLPNLQALGMALEWDAVLNGIGAYEDLARRVCATSRQKGAAQLRCFVPEGHEVLRDIACP
ncbi:MAG: hypothetical protein EOO40_07090 [Deltaproteobacteria bacterium]|nr:MAG: hypothetical protein EOO40_07090 [Deltaproteobacteria bacterium]